MEPSYAYLVIDSRRLQKAQWVSLYLSIEAPATGMRLADEETETLPHLRHEV
jgi:hypothetical protein